MGLVIKILLLIVVIFIVVALIVGAIAGIYIYKTVQQGKRIIELTQNKSIQQDAQDFANGNCSKLASVEMNMAQLQTEIIEACKNPILKSQIQKQAEAQFEGLEGRDICIEVNNPASQIFKDFEQMKTYCENKTATLGVNQSAVN